MSLYLINLIVNVFIILIFVRALLSWVPDLARRYRQATRLLESVTDPVIAPFRRMVPPSRTGGLDISPVLAVIALMIIRRVLFLLLAGWAPCR